MGEAGMDAFLNSHGGYLLIGVADDGEAVAPGLIKRLASPFGLA